MKHVLLYKHFNKSNVILIYNFIMIKKVLYGIKLFLVFICLFLYSILAISVKTFLLRGDTFYSWCLFAFLCIIPAYLLLSKIRFFKRKLYKKSENIFNLKYNSFFTLYLAYI